jgi:hypothetical protein
MRIQLARAEPRVRGKWFFLVAFWSSCTLFWWLPSIIFRGYLGIDDPVSNGTLLISLLAVGVFSGAYLLPHARTQMSVTSESRIRFCSEIAYRLTLFIAVPAFVVAARFALYRASVAYGTGEGIPGWYQLILYVHLFFGFMFLGSADRLRDVRRIIVVIILLILPRFFISLHWGRFFVAQAIVPILMISVARGWTRLSLRRTLQFALVALVIVFVPALTRGDDLSGQDALVTFFAEGSTLRLFQDNTMLDLSGYCPPLLVSMTAKVVPYHALKVCTVDIWGERGLPATLDRILAAHQAELDGVPSVDFLVGPGSNYLLELYLSGGLVVLIGGSALFGYVCRSLVNWTGQGSLFAGIWAVCLTRALLAPRSNLGYVFELVPGLILATALFIGLAGELMGGERTPNSSPLPLPSVRISLWKRTG